MEDDEILAEVRRARAKLFQSAGGTIEGLAAMLQKAEAAETRPLVSLPPKRPATTPTAGGGSP